MDKNADGVSAYQRYPEVRGLQGFDVQVARLIDTAVAKVVA